eukprot:6213383-Pleurochrysis_carterae.AAC.1
MARVAALPRKSPLPTAGRCGRGVLRARAVCGRIGVGKKGRERAGKSFRRARTPKSSKYGVLSTQLSGGASAVPAIDQARRELDVDLAHSPSQKRASQQLSEKDSNVETHETSSALGCERERQRGSCVRGSGSLAQVGCTSPTNLVASSHLRR